MSHSRLPWSRFTLLAALLAAPLTAQTHLGQDFWLADTYSSASGGFTIAIANPSTTTANVSLFNLIEGPTSDTVLPGAVKLFTFPEHDLGVQGTTISMDPVYHVTSDIDVAVFLFDPLANEAFNDASLVLPVPSLGLRHRIANFVNPENSSGQFVVVVAVTPGLSTSVQVLDDTQTVVNSVSLQQGEMFQRINSINVGATPADDMTGWEVVSDQPVAVFSGSNGTSVGMPSGAADILVEQLLDNDRLSLGYAVAPLRTRPLGCTTAPTCAADVFRFVATENGTVLTTTPSVGGGTFNEADYLEIATSTPFVIQGSKPFFGYQYLASTDATYGSLPAASWGDPALLDVIPPEQFRRDYLFHVEATFPDNFANIVAPVGATLFLDNSPITAPCDAIGTLNGTAWCSIRLPVSSGTHRIHSTDSDFGLTVTGFQFFSSYAYVPGLGRACLPGLDGWMKDTPGDDGTEPNPSTANMWESGDIWIRNQPDPNLVNQHQHQNPIANVVNYVYVKLRNRGCDPITRGDLNTYYAKASTGLAWPTNWIGNPPNGDQIGSLPVTFVAANGERVLEFPWTPSATGHFCLLARWLSPDDPMTFAEGSSVHLNTKNNNNIAWKNVNVVEAPMGPPKFTFIARNVEPVPADVDLVFEGGPDPSHGDLPGAAAGIAPRGSVLVRLTPAMFQAWQAGGGVSQDLRLLPGTRVFEVLGPLARLEHVPMAAGEEHPVGLWLDHHDGTSPTAPFVVSQFSTVGPSTRLDGGVTYVFE